MSLKTAALLCFPQIKSYRGKNNSKNNSQDAQRELIGVFGTSVPGPEAELKKMLFLQAITLTYSSFVKIIRYEEEKTIVSTFLFKPGLGTHHIVDL